MTWWEIALIAVAGLWAGTINTVVGSGTLVTFPVLVALGFPPVTATTSNAIGLITGTITGAYGYREELRGHGRRLVRYGIASLFGAIGGTVLLLSLPADAFETIVPVLVAAAVLLVAVQPLLTKRLRDRDTGSTGHPWLLYPLIFLVGVYGGYFTAAQGIMLVGVMGLLLDDPLQRLNAFKNALAAVVNLVAGAIYAVVAPIDWTVVLILAISSTVGGLLGARIGRKLSPVVLRVVIVVIGVVAIVDLLLTS
ncbi:sulfite exporter TauE/SafE family protein [Actinomycetospora termitidis]|uniref:Probable membrane transporter protein n=1 Tax=Actinomycetospora termitidis TaxID=3053470 RepID=A0ABT7M3X7_9PSEU|nr:sulfite exporter TauE/SafE family protein [Actinomycetospora sp. Odt1-22]MDL5155378.1 sulfite exporter TauE/SafE family protein [Actinomycetospora sp. Odt1-22]